MSTDLWDRIWEEDEESTPPPGPGRPEPGRREEGERRVLARRLRLLALVAVSALVAAVSVHLWPFVTTDEVRAPGTVVAGPRVAAWTVWGEEGPGGPFVAVLAAEGGNPPLAVAIPSDVVTSVPGQGLATVGEAAGEGDAVVVGTLVQNLLGTRVDASVATQLPGVGRIVDALGGVEVEGGPMDGQAVVRYLGRARPPVALFRWQEVLAAVVSADAPSRTEAVPEGIRPMIGTGGPADVLALPTRDAGAGVIRPDDEAIASLVEEQFGARPGGYEIRLVVLNGNGRPGIGQEVARILVPEGFRVVASQNARTFDVQTTQIIASSGDDLPAAQRARRLLGTGDIRLGNQPAGLADVTVVVGHDFGGA